MQELLATIVTLLREQQALLKEIARQLPDREELEERLDCVEERVNGLISDSDLEDFWKDEEV